MASTTGKVISCKAAVVREFQKPMTVELVDVDVPHEREVRVKVVAAGLCHTDYVWLQGTMPDQPLPFILGHEGAGIVESIGNGVVSLHPGDKVLTIFMSRCEKCRQCLKNRTNLCQESWGNQRGRTFSRHTGYDGKPRFSIDGQPVYHLAGTSVFCEYVVVPENSCVKVNPKATLEKVCLLACGFSAGYGSTTNAIDIEPDDKVAIWGLGIVGLAAVVGCKDRRAGRIIGIDISPDKEQLGRQMGLTDFINPNQQTKSVVEIINEMTNGDGLDFAVVCVGQSEIMETAFSCTNAGGTALMVGFGDFTSFKVNAGLLFFGRKIKASVIGDYNIMKDLPKLADRYIDGKLPLDNLITHTFKVEQINEAIELMKQGKSIRSVIVFN